VIVCAPTVKVLVVSVARPFVNVPVPRIVAPSRNVMEPVAPEEAAAVKVTACPTIEGLSDEITVTVGVGFATVTVVGAEVAGLLLVSPDVVAVIGFVPIGNEGTVMVAVPPTIGAVPIVVPPFENVTVPVTPGGTVSVIVSDVFGGTFGFETTGGGITGVALLTICVSGTEVAALLLESPL